MLGDYKVRRYRSPKVIHDPVWGTHRFEAFEAALIDSPVLQRLRRIHQTGFAYLTFPAARHSRFEHSIGAAVVATRMLTSIAARRPDVVNLNPLTGDLATIRVAALLHDCGHGFASHASEHIYKWHPDIEAARDDNEVLADAPASEVIAWHIVTSHRFREFIDGLNAEYRSNIDPDTVANLILGQAPDDRSFLAEIITGPFDVDRVDYIVRDAHQAGIGAAIDLDRFFHDIDVNEIRGRLHLVLHSAHAIEQILTTKVHLFMRLYRHQKVLAADGMIQAIVPLVRSGERLYDLTFDSVSDFLRLTDYDLLATPVDAVASPAILEIMRNLQNRELPQRCAVVSADHARQDFETGAKIYDLVSSISSEPNGAEALRDEIHERIPPADRPPVHTIIPSFLHWPPLREASLVYVLYGNAAKARTLNQLFRIDRWLDTYSEQHWAGFVFGPRSSVEQIGVAARDVLRDRGIDLAVALAPEIGSAVVTAIAPISRGATPVPKRPRLPVLEGFVQTWELEERGTPLEHLHAICVLHFLPDLPPLMRHLQTLGLDPTTTALIRKPYPYPSGDSVAAELRREGYTIEECTAVEDASEPALRALTQLRVRFKAGDRMIVIEDGGYITPLLHQAEFSSLREACVGSVEQTTRGLRNIERIPTLALPVVSIASSALKLEEESPEVGDTLASILDNFFRNYREIPLRRVRALILGAGTIGRYLASSLAARGATVSLYDSDDSRLEDLPEGCAAVTSLDEIGAHNLLIGATGSQSLSEQHLLAVADDAILASVSSDQDEIDEAGLRRNLAAPPDQHMEMEWPITWYNLSNGRRVGLLGYGYPINFVLGEGIAKAVVDPVLTALVAGALQLVLASPRLEAGIYTLDESYQGEIRQRYRDQLV